MKRYRLTLELLEDTIFTARSATVGAPKSLDYIPGATLYGACAAKLYSSLSVPDQFSVFHSGKVRFGNGLPGDSTGKAAYPMPLSWHVEKGTDPYLGTDKNRLDARCIINCLRSKTDQTETKPQPQLKQLRSGYINHYGELYNPSATFRMKTAIELKSETAAEAQLYGYAAIQAGQRFTATLEIDDEHWESSQANAIINQLKSSLNGKLRLGRSRSAQYGTVKCDIEDDAPEQTESVDCSNGLVLWLLSDAALRDDYGQPTLIVSAKNLGLETGLEVDWQKTFVRTRQYSPFNGKRRCHDQERQVLVQGSIISFCAKQDHHLSSSEVSKLQRGIGDYLHSGLGQVLVQPPLLKHQTPKFDPRPTSSTTTAKIDTPALPVNPLTDWLSAFVGQSEQQSKTRSDALTLLKELEGLYQSASGFAAVKEHQFIGPGKSQWGRIAALARSSEIDTVSTQLENIVGLSKVDDNAVYSDADWAIDTGLDSPQSSFAEWLLHHFGQGKKSSDVLLVLATYALDLVDDLQTHAKTPSEQEATDA